MKCSKPTGIWVLYGGGVTSRVKNCGVPSPSPSPEAPSAATTIEPPSSPSALAATEPPSSTETLSSQAFASTDLPRIPGSTAVASPPSQLSANDIPSSPHRHVSTLLGSSQVQGHGHPHATHPVDSMNDLPVPTETSSHSSAHASSHSDAHPRVLPLWVSLSRNLR